MVPKREKGFRKFAARKYDTLTANGDEPGNDRGAFELADVDQSGRIAVDCGSVRLRRIAPLG